MRIHLLSVGNRAPGWVSGGFEEYARRMPKECALHLVEMSPAKCGRSVNVATRVAQEGERMLAAVPKNSIVVTLDETGAAWSTRQLSEYLDQWLHSGQNLCLMIGGADGLSEACKKRADHCWSLSALTLPHMLVRVVVSEQLYRAWSLLSGHPYHRD